MFLKPKVCTRISTTALKGFKINRWASLFEFTIEMVRPHAPK